MGNILLIEDDEDLRQNISERLTVTGFTVCCAVNGRDALQTMASFRPDLIICDVLMPVMDGFEFLARKQANGFYRSIPLIFLTAKVALEDKLTGLEGGAIDYITKPFQARELILKVTNLLTLQAEMLNRGLQQTQEEDAPEFAFVKQLNDVLEQNYRRAGLSVGDLAAQMCMSVSALNRGVNRYFKKSVGDLVKEYRLTKSTHLLINTDKSVEEIAANCGFSSLSYFSRSFKKNFSVSPIRFRLTNLR